MDKSGRRSRAAGSGRIRRLYSAWSNGLVLSGNDYNEMCLNISVPLAWFMIDNFSLSSFTFS
jgi:hypothetical protein